MSIWEFSGRHLRNSIGFVEEDPPGEAIRELKDLRGHDLYRFEESHLTDRSKLQTTGAVIIRQHAEKPTRVLQQLERYAATLLWHDCRVFVQAVPAEPEANGPAFRSMVFNALNTLKLPPSVLSDDDAKAFGEWYEGRDTPPLPPFVHVLELPGIWSDVAARLRDYPVDDPPHYDLRIDVLDVDGKPSQLTPEQEILLRRSFSNCTSIQLVGLKNGLSKMPTFRAFAHLLDLDGGAGSNWPFLYFVKIGERAKIAKEYRAYRASALEHIPYHLGPRLRLNRCNLGHTQGIIVSDYVSGAETMRDCARNGRAVPVIANLFNSTLLAWRNSAKPEQIPLQEYLCKKMSLPIPRHRKPLIDTYGASMSPEKLKTMVMAIDTRPVLVGVIHGDLHATNVLVRGNDAIVIDFEKVETRAPLLWDMASLEGGLFVDGFIGDRRSGQDVLKSVACLYKTTAFEGDILPCDSDTLPWHPSDGSAWFFDCVRQIRMQARQIEYAPRQYALALAAALARKACNDEDFSKEKTDGLSREDVRALAYVLSEWILVGISRDDSAQTTAE